MHRRHLKREHNCVVASHLRFLLQISRRRNRYLFLGRWNSGESIAITFLGKLARGGQQNPARINFYFFSFLFFFTLLCLQPRSVRVGESFARSRNSNFLSNLCGFDSLIYSGTFLSFAVNVEPFSVLRAFRLARRKRWQWRLRQHRVMCAWKFPGASILSTEINR